MTKTQKKELKARLFKILHGVCYVLSAIFVLVLIVASIKGCSPKKQRVNTPQSLAPQQLVYNYETPYYVYYSVYESDSTDTIDIETQQLMVGDSLDLTSSTTETDVYYKYIYDKSVMGGEVISYDGADILTISSIRLSYAPFELSGEDSTSYYRLSGIYYFFTNNTSYSILSKANDYANDYVYGTSYFAHKYSVTNDIKSLFDEPSLCYLFTSAPVGNFIFNKEYNYNAPIGLNVDMLYGASITIAHEVIIGGIYRFKYDMPLFYSNGRMYDQIVVDYDNAYSNWFLINNKVIKGDLDTLSYFAMGYRRADGSGIDFVNYRTLMQYRATDTDVVYNYKDIGSYWINDQYRYVTFLEELSISQRNLIESFNNNNQYNGGTIYGGDHNVFTLIGTAFTGILPILSIMILPNITLGMLLFVPLVAILVFAIIKVLKK